MRQKPFRVIRHIANSGSVSWMRSVGYPCNIDYQGGTEMTTMPENGTPEEDGSGRRGSEPNIPAQGPTPPYYYGLHQPPKKKHRLRNSLLIAGAALVLLVGVIVGVAAAIGNNVNNAVNPNHASTSASNASSAGGTSASTPPPAAPAMLSQGEPASITQGNSNAASVTVTSVSTSTTPADQFGSSPQNGYFVVANVTVTVDSSFTQGFDINPLDFYVLNGSTQYSEGNGNAYDGLSDSASELDATTLGAGQQTSGPIVFDVSSPHGYVVYAPNINGQWKY
jgi:hypothetical protein